MSKHIIVFLLIALAGCKSRNANTGLQQPWKLESITALDLSENRSVLSTKNDEILVSIFFGTEIEDKWYFNGYYLDQIVFDSLHQTEYFDDIDLSTKGPCDHCEVWICLTEIDDDNSEDSTHNKLLSLINEKGYNALESKSKVDAIIKDNDFLGYIKVPYYVENIDTNFYISGSDLLDKYTYRVKISSTSSRLD
ncbi:MAG: hypothetical protein ACPGYY_00935 [Bacteroidia bacterium]